MIFRIYLFALKSALMLQGIIYTFSASILGLWETYGATEWYYQFGLCWDADPFSLSAMIHVSDLLIKNEFNSLIQLWNEYFESSTSLQWVMESHLCILFRRVVHAPLSVVRFSFAPLFYSSLLSPWAPLDFDLPSLSALLLCYPWSFHSLAFSFFSSR